MPSKEDAADIYAAVNVLYDYGRNEEELNKLASSDELVGAIRNSGIWGDHPIFAYVRRSHESR